MSMNVTLPAVALTTLLLGACSSSVEPQQQNIAPAVQSKTMQVQVMYRDRSLLPPGAELKVTLADVSLMDAPAKELASKTLPLEGAPPYNVELTFDSSEVIANMRYSVSAKVTRNGELLYITTEHNDPFGTVQSQSPIKVMMEKVAKPDVSLTNTYWKAITLKGNKVQVTEREPHMQFHDDGKVSGYLGCNNFTGQYVKGQHFGLRFKAVASTKKMCMDSMAQESAMSAALMNTFSYDIMGEKLVLRDEQGSNLATFQAVYFN